MDLLRICVEAISILLMVIVVVALVATTVVAAKAAKNGSHGCGPVVTEDWKDKFYACDEELDGANRRIGEVEEELDVENQRYKSLLSRNDRLSKQIETLEKEVQWWKDNSGPDC